MRAFAEAWPDPALCEQLVSKLPWGQNIKLLAVRDPTVRLWYAQAAVEHGWSRAVLAIQIDTKAHARQGQALTNFGRVLPPETSDLAQQLLKVCLLEPHGDGLGRMLFEQDGDHRRPGRDNGAAAAPVVGPDPTFVSPDAK